MIGKQIDELRAQITDRCLTMPTDDAIALLDELEHIWVEHGIKYDHEDQTDSTPEQSQIFAMARGLCDQVEKEHYLNVHFRAFELAYTAWKFHVRANAITGSRQCGSPAGAVLDDERSDTGV